MHKCPRCKTETDDYYYSKGKRDSMCKPCRKAYRREEKRVYTAEYIAEHKEEQTTRQKVWRDNNWERQLWLWDQRRTRKSGLPFTIEVTDIIIPQICPVFKVPLQKNTPFAPSLDRFIPELGYVPGNVHVISRKANTIKSNATLTEMKMLLEWMQLHTDPSTSL